MDVERTIQFILDQQANHQARSETEMAIIRRTLVETTQVQLEQARILVRIEEAQQASEEKLKELASAHQATEQALQELAGAQQVTEQKLQNLIDALGRSTNGH